MATLKEIIELLETYPKSRVVKLGFENPHSYWSYSHEQLAFEPTPNVTVMHMLEQAQSCIGREFTDRMGRKVEMGEHTNIWLAEVGNFGEQLGLRLLRYMLEDVQEPSYALLRMMTDVRLLLDRPEPPRTTKRLATFLGADQELVEEACTQLRDEGTIIAVKTIVGRKKVSNWWLTTRYRERTQRKERTGE